MNKELVVVIGGSAGMGFAVAKCAKDLGAEVWIGGRDPERLDRAAKSLGVEGRCIDTMDEDSVKRFFSEVGPVHHLATPGSSVRLGPLRETDSADVVFSLHNKFLGQALCAKYANIVEGGSITLFSGMLSQRPGQQPLLGAINSAVETLAKGLAVELAPIRVNAVSPGLTRNTRAFGSLSPEDQEKMFAGAASQLPVRRVGEPMDAAAATMFLMQNSFVTGQVLIVDGGASAI